MKKFMFAVTMACFGCLVGSRNFCSANLAVESDFIKRIEDSVKKAEKASKNARRITEKCDLQKSFLKKNKCALEDDECDCYESVFYSGDSYTGTNRIEINEEDDYGIIARSDGRVYEGEFKYGKIDGHGIFIFSDGEVYKGEFRDGNRNGWGMSVFADGSTYKGGWKNGKVNSWGIRISANGDRYEGELKDGKMDGQGTLIVSASVNRYEGKWEYGKLNGRGTLFHENGCEETADWENNKLVRIVERKNCDSGGGIITFAEPPYVNIFNFISNTSRSDEL